MDKIPVGAQRGQEDESSQRGVDRGVDSATEKGMETGQSRAAVIKDKDSKLLTDSEKVLKRWTYYCNSLYNYELCTDTSILQKTQSSREGKNSPPVLKKEVEAGVKSLKAGKSPGVGNIPSELLKSRA